MRLTTEQINLLQHSVIHYPYPIAHACSQYLEEMPEDPWRSWELFSRGILQPILSYMSHLLLSDLIAMGEKPAHLFHHIQAILSRPMAGQYVGFLRETARHYNDHNLESAIPELVQFVIDSEINCNMLEDNRALLGLLVEYRNAFAHARILSEDYAEKTVHEVSRLTFKVLDQIRFLSNYSLRMEDGMQLMGHAPEGLLKKSSPLQVLTADNTSLCPLLLKLERGDIVLLEEADVSKLALTYRGAKTYHRFTKKELQKGDPALILEALKESLARVRSVEAMLPLPNWDDFAERVDIATQRSLSEYQTTNKYDPATYVPRPVWEGENSIFWRFLDSQQSLLAISGGQGTGKSALAAHLTRQCVDDGHAVLFINAQRLTYADVKWSENPVPNFLHDLLCYKGGLDAKSLKRLSRQVPDGKKIIVIFDAVNEIDSIVNKWNPFRALEEILSWVCAAGEPNIKFVVSFRLNLYESFDYLKAGSLPANIFDISFEGNNIDKPWVHDLEPFGVDQARELFELLQPLPERCMAPAMSWEFISSALGDNLKNYTENPLLFSIFLHAHHRSDKILAIYEDALFITYANQLTGVAALKNRPWPQKLWGFIKNGNITRKERFLVDCIQRMGKNGTAAIVIDQLDPKNKQDKRILEFLSLSDDKDLKDLTEGKLLNLETIEMRQKEQVITTRRLSFIGELMAVALDGVEERVQKLTGFRSFFCMATALFFIICILAIVIDYAAKQRFESEAQNFFLNLGGMEYSLNFLDQVDDLSGRLRSLFWHAVFSMFGFLVLWSVYIVTVYVFLRRQFLFKAQDIGLFSSGSISFYERRNFENLTKILLKILPVPIIMTLVLLFSRRQLESDYFYIDWGLVGVILNMPEYVFFAPVQIGLPLFALYLLSPWGFYKFSVIDDSQIPNRVLRNIHQTRLNAYQDLCKRKYILNHNLKFFLLAGIVFVGTTSFAFIYNNPPIFQTTEAHSAFELEFLRNVFKVPYLYYLKESSFDRGLFLLSIGTVLFLILSEIYINRFALIKISRLYLSRLTVFPQKKTARLLLIHGNLIPIFIFAIIFLFEYANPIDHLNDRRRAHSQASVLSILSEEPNLNKRILDLRNYMISGIQADYISKNSQIHLYLPDQQGLRVDVGGKKTFIISGNPESLVNLEQARPPISSSLLILYNPEGWFGSPPKGSEYHFSRIFIEGRVTNFSGLDAFPWLQTLSLEEEYAAQAFPTLPPKIWNNLEIIIHSKSYPKLDWLNPEIVQYIIHLKSAPTSETQNLEMLERVIMNGDDLELSLLSRLTNAKWLMLVLNKQPTGEWLQLLYTHIETDLPDLLTMGIAIGEWQWLPTTGRDGNVYEGTPEEFLDKMKPCIAGEKDSCIWFHPFEKEKENLLREYKRKFDIVPNEILSIFEKADYESLIQWRKELRETGTLKSIVPFLNIDIMTDG